MFKQLVNLETPARDLHPGDLLEFYPVDYVYAPDTLKSFLSGNPIGKAYVKEKTRGSLRPAIALDTEIGILLEVTERGNVVDGSFRPECDGHYRLAFVSTGKLIKLALLYSASLNFDFSTWKIL